ncbi:hypothetical protein GCM10017783_25420 [Deinococcus piscis]|uniref:Uncharacterized protein n=1 Tax=Deinococcus piscis TaxID=394230 RepID=A0ABQ3KBX2_9DEIO|nr:hypothetical protein GCM10017783_25420 [Deinococcus piscis]
MFAAYGKLQFLISYQVYQGKHTSTPVTLALDLLEEVPDFSRKCFRVFLGSMQRLKFVFVVSVGATIILTILAG